MKKLLIGTAFILIMSQASYAVDDQKILSVIKAEMKDMEKLCLHLDKLPKADKERLGGIVFGEAKNEPQKEIKKLMEDNLSLFSCINDISTEQPGW